MVTNAQRLVIDELEESIVKPMLIEEGEGLDVVATALTDDDIVECFRLAGVEVVDDSINEEQCVELVHHIKMHKLLRSLVNRGLIEERVQAGSVGYMLVDPTTKLN